MWTFLRVHGKTAIQIVLDPDMRWQSLKRQSGAETQGLERPGARSGRPALPEPSSRPLP